MSDILSNQSRNFYERTKGKLALSLLVASTGLMLLGFCAYSGGMSRSLQIQVRRVSSKVLHAFFLLVCVRTDFAEKVFVISADYCS